MLRLVLLLIGCITLGFLIHYIGPARIWEAASGLGPLALLVILIPSAVMYTLEALGWRATLGDARQSVGFGRLFAIRSAGEVVNMTTPMAYVGGEPLKAYLLKRCGVPLVDGLASVVTAKTTMTLAEIVFIVLGIVLWAVAPPDGRTGLPAAAFA
ncbi:MAG TPA: flippase-like domain-containing protein, partial [Nitrospirales bacterium]|nr:flippase-like domain-containing protein [Nitrospirales bacterium]